MAYFYPVFKQVVKKIDFNTFPEVDSLPVTFNNEFNKHDIANMFRIQDFCNSDIKEIMSEVVKILKTQKEWKCE